MQKGYLHISVVGEFAVGATARVSLMQNSSTGGSQLQLARKKD